MVRDPKSASYVYCIVKTDAVPRVTAARGLPGTGKPRALEVGGGYWLIVSSASLASYDGSVIDAHLRDLDWVGKRAAIHEAVVEESARTYTTIPMKLFTLFASEERAAAHVRKMKRSLDRVSKKIDGCHEWGLRVLFEETRAAEAAPPKPRVASGIGFLQAKKSEQDGKRRLVTEAKARADELFARLEDASRDARKRAAPNRELEGRVLLDAVFLVPRGRASKFASAVRGPAKELAKGGCHVALTGPWPAYSFVHDGKDAAAR